MTTEKYINRKLSEVKRNLNIIVSATYDTF